MIDGAFAQQPPPYPGTNFTPSPPQTQPYSAPQTQETMHHPSTVQDFDELIHSKPLAIAFFTSETCGPCKMIEPTYNSLSKTHTNITFIHIDTQKQFAIAKENQITATPTFKTYLHGILQSEWKGANPSALDSNLSRLLEVARPPLPPSLRGCYAQSPILFSRSPPIEKVVPKLPPVFPKPLLNAISSFLAAKGVTDVLVPPLVAWADVQRNLDYDVENAWMVIDLLRAACADRRVSGWFVVDGLDVIGGIVKTVAKRDESEWQLRVVTVQLVPPPSPPSPLRPSFVSCNCDV